jgi:hypothetical protein
MRFFRTLLLVCLVMPAGAGSTGIDSTSTHAGGRITITSLPSSGVVFLDSVYRGNTPLTLDSVSAGKHLLRIAGHAPTDWLSDIVVDTVTVQAGVAMDLHYRLPQRTALLSSPGSAEVYSGDSLLGVTPLLIPPDASLMQPLVVKKAGYASALVQPGDSSGNVLIATLTPVWQPTETRGSDEQAETVTNKVPVFVAGAVAVAAGVGAAYFKIRADRREGEFAISHDPSARDDVKHFDLLAGVFLVASQAGMVALSAMLLNQ